MSGRSIRNRRGAKKSAVQRLAMVARNANREYGCRHDLHQVEPTHAEKKAREQIEQARLAKAEAKRLKRAEKRQSSVVENILKEK